MEPSRKYRNGVVRKGGEQKFGEKEEGKARHVYLSPQAR